MEDVARWLRPTAEQTNAVFEAGGDEAIGVRTQSSDILKMPMAKVYKVRNTSQEPSRLHVGGLMRI